MEKGGAIFENVRLRKLDVKPVRQLLVDAAIQLLSDHLLRMKYSLRCFGIWQAH